MTRHYREELLAANVPKVITDAVIQRIVAAGGIEIQIVETFAQLYIKTQRFHSTEDNFACIVQALYERLCEIEPPRRNASRLAHESYDKKVRMLYSDTAVAANLTYTNLAGEAQAEALSRKIKSALAQNTEYPKSLKERLQNMGINMSMFREKRYGNNGRPSLSHGVYRAGPVDRSANGMHLD